MDKGPKYKGLAAITEYGKLTQAITDARRGFFCIICSSLGLNAISYRSNNFTLRFLLSNRIYYNWDFC